MPVLGIKRKSRCEAEVRGHEGPRGGMGATRGHAMRGHEGAHGGTRGRALTEPCNLAQAFSRSMAQSCF